MGAASGHTASAAELFWNDSTGIHRLNSDQPAGADAIFDTFEARGLAVDPSAQRLWWSDVLPLGAPIPGGVIRTGSATGGRSDNIVGPGLPAPAGVAVDVRRGKVYWTDLGDASSSSAVFSANLDGSDPQRIVSGPSFSEIAGIAIDPLRDKLYFTYINPLIDAVHTGGIARADLDGGNIEPLVGGLGKPIGIAVDPYGGQIYWADARELSAGGGDGRIQATDLDGQHIATILGGLDVPYGVALDLDERYVYWTDMGTGKIQRTGMPGVLPFFQDVVTGLKDPTALAIPIVTFRPGDATGDDRVDRADMAVLAENYGRSGAGVNWFAGDFNGDQLVSQIDLGILQAALHGDGSGATALATVPEPATAVVVVLGVLICVARMTGLRNLQSQCYRRSSQ
jgi:DNA-binding beta-propeller fold protein YncE